jgi:hypothetical protein
MIWQNLVRMAALHQGGYRLFKMAIFWLFLGLLPSPLSIAVYLHLGGGIPLTPRLSNKFRVPFLRKVLH